MCAVRTRAKRAFATSPRHDEVFASTALNLSAVRAMLKVMLSHLLHNSKPQTTPCMTPKHMGLIVLLCLFQWQCTPEITCVDIGCPFGQTCNKTSGECELPVSDCRENANLCQSNERCDQATGRCLSNQVSCINQRACPLGQVCNAETGICQNVGTCNANQDCEVNEQCDLDAGRCVPKPCENSTVCGQGFVCDNNICVVGCDEQTPCPTEALCRIDPGQRVGQCITSCTQDTDCNFGRYCNNLKSPPSCDPEPPCERDDNCRSDEICQDFACVRPPCTGDQDCDEDQVCNASSGICVGGSCIEDAFSPNHTQSQAKPLPQGTTVQLNHCPGRPDWYALEVTRDELVQIQLEHVPSQDLDVILYDDQLQPLVEDQQLSGVARVAYQATRAQRLWLKVTTSNFSSSAYSISLVRRQGGECIDDDLEDNDTLEQATALNIQQDNVLSVPTKLCRTDVDWYALGDFEDQFGLTLSVRPDRNLNIDAAVLTPDGQTLRLDENNDLSLLRVGFAGPYYLRLQSRRAQSGNVRINVSVRGDYSCPDAVFNSEPENAVALLANQLETLILCPLQESWELDWYSITPPSAPAVLTFKVARPTTNGLVPSNLQVVLFEQPANAPPRPIRQANDDGLGVQTISAVVSPDKQYLVRVTSNDNPGRLIEHTAYQVVYQYDPL